MRTPKPEWVAALRALCGAESNIRFNEHIGRWEFMLPEADGNIRSQFWGWFRDGNGNAIEPDAVTGAYPFRELDDSAMREALRNLEETYIGNPWNGAGTTRREVQRRIDFNHELRQSQFKAAGDLWADMYIDRLSRIKGNPVIQVPVVIGA